MAEQNTSPSQQVMETQQLFWDALKAKNAAAFKRVLAVDFLARSPGQPDQRRKEFIATLTSFPAEVLSIGSDNLIVHVFEGVVVLTGVQVARLCLPQGMEIEDTLALTNVFRLTESGWLMVLSHAVQLPAET